MLFNSTNVSLPRGDSTWSPLKKSRGKKGLIDPFIEERKQSIDMSINLVDVKRWYSVTSVEKRWMDVGPAGHAQPRGMDVEIQVSKQIDQSVIMIQSATRRSNAQRRAKKRVFPRARNPVILGRLFAHLPHCANAFAGSRRANLAEIFG